MTRRQLSEPFDVQYTITFSGRTVGDGIKTLTPPMVRDKLIAVLEEMLYQGHIRDYTVSIARNNIAEAKETIKKSKT